MSPTIQNIDLPMPQGTADAILAQPEGGGSYPGILFLMDAIGLRPVIEGMAGRLAAQGYVVLAPNLFYRAGRAPILEIPNLRNPEERTAYFEKLMPMIGAQGFTPEVQAQDAGAYLDFLEQRTDGPFGVVGYCMGGGMAIRTAEAYPDRVAAVASFHAGNLATEAENSPHLGVGKIRGEIYVGHADQDHSMPPEQIERLENALRESGATYRTELYTGAPHGWTMADMGAYHPEGAERHWDRLLDLFRRTLG